MTNRGDKDLIERLANSLAVFTKHYAPWMDAWKDEDQQSSTFSKHTFGELREALKLIAEADAFVTANPTPSPEPHEDGPVIRYDGTGADAIRQIKAAERIAELETALQPFAEAAAYYSDGIHRPIAEDAMPCGPALLVGHLRRARAALETERTFLSSEARRYASHYPESSDGRNTFIMFAEMIEARKGGGE